MGQALSYEAQSMFLNLDDLREADKVARVQVYDNVLLLGGPDMGKTGTVINIEEGNAVVKLDKDGKAYQEVKQVDLSTLAKAIETDCDEKCLKEKERKAMYAKDKEKERLAREKKERS